MKNKLLILLILLSIIVKSQTTNPTPTRFTNGLLPPARSTTPVAGLGSLWWDTTAGNYKYYNGTGWVAFGSGSGGSGTVTSVNMTVPTGLTISGNPVTSAGTLSIGLQSGYSIPTIANQANWTTAFGWGNHALSGYAKIDGGNTFSSQQIIAGNIFSNGNVNSLSIIPTYSLSGAGGYSSLYISPYQSSLGSGNKYLINVGVNGAPDNSGAHTQRFTVENNGAAYFSGNVSSAPAPTASYHLANKAYVDAAVAGGGGSGLSGFYTPTATYDPAITSVSFEEHQYTVVGDIVTIYGSAQITFNGTITADFSIINLSVPSLYPIGLSKPLFGNGVAAQPQFVTAVWATRNSSGGPTADILVRTNAASGVKYIFYSFRYQSGGSPF